MNVSNLYDTMKQRGLVSTKDSFSSDWLGMYWSYYAKMGERTSSGALLWCWKKLQSCGEHDLARSVFTLINDRTQLNKNTVTLRQFQERRNEVHS